MTVGENIQTIRKSLGMSQEELGQKLLVSRQTISLWEKNQTVPTMDNLIRLREIFGVSTDEILGFENAIQTATDISKKDSGLNDNNNKFKKNWNIILIILCSPIWFSLLVATIAVALSLYVSLWTVIIFLWAGFASIIGCGVGALIVGFGFTLGSNRLSGLALLGAGLVCLGLSIFMFYGCKSTTKGALLLTKNIILRIKNTFEKRRRPNEKAN